MRLTHLLLAVATLAQFATASFAQSTDWFATQKLIQEVDAGKPNPDILFVEYPKGVSQVQTLLNTPHRVLPHEGDARYFAYRVGEGLGLKAGAAYVLAIDFPEDVSRSMFICNWGNETAMGVATGQSIGDVLRGRYVGHNPESIQYPLSGKTQTWSQLFYLHDRFPEIKRPRGGAVRPLTPQDGFWVIIAQPAALQDPLGAGAAISRIRLYEVTDPSALDLKLNLPPEGLPQRRVFSREEMADGVASMGHKPEEQDEKLRGVKDIVRWHEDKMKILRFLGGNTYTRDLLEFGHNQGWDSAPGGGNAWYNQSSTPWLWEQVVAKAKQHGLDVLPYYEYRGSIGQDPKIALGSQKRSKRLDGGDVYTHISWCENANADITDPETIADACKLIDHTIGRYKDQARFAGAWFRQRPTAMPVSFNEANLRLFAKEANDGQRISRSHLQADKALLDKYYAWWFTKRHAFFEALRDHLRKTIGPEAFLLYTNDPSEPGISLPRSITGAGKPDGWQWRQVVVNDDMPRWTEILKDQNTYKYIMPLSLDDALSKHMHLGALATWAENWDKWEVNHSTPPNDPQNWQGGEGALLTYTFNRLYTVGDPSAFNAYRTKSGLAAVRHYPLNENEMHVGDDEILGYFVADVERSGPHCMLSEARAVAYGDPFYLASLTANTYNHGFPQYVRRFNAAYLALPALPSEVLPDACSDKEIVVRQIKTPNDGTYLAIVNTGLSAKQGISIQLPPGQQIEDVVTAQPLSAPNGTLALTMDPAELRTIRIRQ